METKLVRLTTGPLPLTGMLLGEDITISGKPLLKVAVYGYSTNRPEYWLKADCRDLTAEERNRFDVAAWLALARR